VSARAAQILALGVALAVAAAAAPPGRAAPAGGEVVRGTHAGRAYRLFVPAAPRADAAVPLVLALHGCGQTPDDFALGTRLDAAAGRRGRLVLYPAQGAAANPLRCWNWFSPRHQALGDPGSEPAALVALVRAIQARHRLGEGRIVVVGLSAGAYLAVTLACTAPDLVAGVGAVAGGPFRCATGAAAAGACMQGRTLDGEASAAACLAAAGRATLPLRASLWHGDVDPVVAPASLDALTAMFVRVTGARRDGAPPPGPPAGAGAVRTVYRDVHDVAVVERWLVRGLGHAWSGGDPRGSHAAAHGPDATERLLDFLLDG
jgi:poly(hydroxyalkanoate) depolymerase family esterase